MKDNTAISKLARSFEKGLDGMEGDKTSPPSSSKPDRRAPSLQDLTQVYGGTLKRNRTPADKSPNIDAEPKYATLGRVRKEKDAFSPNNNMGELITMYILLHSFQR